MTLLRTEGTGTVAVAGELLIGVTEISVGVGIWVVGRPSVPVVTIGITVFDDVVGVPSLPVVTIGTTVFDEAVGRPSVPVVMVGTTVADAVVRLPSVPVVRMGMAVSDEELDEEAPVPDTPGSVIPEVIGRPVSEALLVDASVLEAPVPDTPGSVIPEVIGRPVSEALPVDVSVLEAPEPEAVSVLEAPEPEAVAVPEVPESEAVAVPGRVIEEVMGKPVPEPKGPVPGKLMPEVLVRIVVPLLPPMGTGVSEVVLIEVSEGEELWLSSVPVLMPVVFVVPVPPRLVDTTEIVEEILDEIPETADDAPDEMPDTAEDATDERPEVTEGIIPPVPAAPVLEMPEVWVDTSVVEEPEDERTEDPGNREAVEALGELVLPRIVDSPTMMPLELVDEGVSAVEEDMDGPVGRSVVSGRPVPVPTEDLVVSDAFVVPVDPVLKLVEVLPDGEIGLVGKPPVEPTPLESVALVSWVELVSVERSVDVSERAEETLDEIPFVALDKVLLMSEITEDKADETGFVGDTTGTTVEAPFVPATVVDDIVVESSELEAEDSDEWLEEIVEAVGWMVVDGREPVEPPPNMELSKEVALDSSGVVALEVAVDDAVGRIGLVGKPLVEA